MDLLDPLDKLACLDGALLNTILHKPLGEILKYVPQFERKDFKTILRGLSKLRQFSKFLALNPKQFALSIGKIIR